MKSTEKATVKAVAEPDRRLCRAIVNRFGEKIDLAARVGRIDSVEILGCFAESVAISKIRALQAENSQSGYDERTAMYWASNAPVGCSPKFIKLWWLEPSD